VMRRARYLIARHEHLATVARIMIS